MHPDRVRPVGRRTAVAVAATVAATTLNVLPATASPVPVPSVPDAAAPATADVAPLDFGLGEVVREAERRVQQHVQREIRREARRQARIQARIEAQRRAAEARSRADRIIELAVREAGDPYVYGAAGPNAFDCSGYTMHVFGQLGISLPHSSAAQASMARRVSDPQVGDLVFFGGSSVYHVGIYAGAGHIWHSPRTGGVVRKERIWTGDVFYGRVG